MAGRQHGVVARRQLVALGLSQGAIRNLVGAGRLHPLRRGVYAVGHLALTRQATLTVAVLAFGVQTAICGHAEHAAKAN